MAYNEFAQDSTVTYTPRNYGELHITATATTVIAVAGTYVKMAGTTTLDSALNFSASGNNRLVCNSLVTSNYFLSLSVSMQTTSSNQTLAMRIYKNGVAETSSTMTTRAETANTPCLLSLNQIINLATNDYIEIWVTNITASNNITAINATLTLLEI